jgi:hypothetical protein
MGIINLSPVANLALRVEQTLNSPILRKSVYLNLLDVVEDVKSCIHDDQKDAAELIATCNELKRHIVNFINREFSDNDLIH